MSYLILKPIGLEIARLLSKNVDSSIDILREQLESVDELALRHGVSVEDTKKFVEGLIVIAERGQLSSILEPVLEREARLANRRFDASETRYRVVFQDDQGLVPELRAFVFLKSEIIDGKLFHFFTSAEAFRHGESDEAVFCFADDVEPDFVDLADAVLRLSRCVDDAKRLSEIDTKGSLGPGVSIIDRGLVPKGNGETDEWYFVTYYASNFDVSEAALIREAVKLAKAAGVEADRMGFDRLIATALERPRRRGAVTRYPRSFRFVKREGVWRLVDS